MKRFYSDVSVVEAEGGWQVALDGRPVKTQLGHPQVVQSRALTDALAEEWARQGDEIDPGEFLFRDHADHAIDVIAPARDEAIAKLIAFAETDTLCYRADPEDALFERQQERWEPVLTRLEDRHSIRFQRVSGVMHRPQSEATLAGLLGHLETLDDFALSALSVLASLAASLCIGLEALQPDADGAALWHAANLEEDWQAEQWGEDAEAAAARERRKADFLVAMEFARLAG